MINSVDLVISYFYALLCTIMLIIIICSNFNGFVIHKGWLNHYLCVLVFIILVIKNVVLITWVSMNYFTSSSSIFTR